MIREGSKRMLQKSRRYLAGGISSNVRAGEQPHPLFFEDGHGSRLRDVDGNEYVDYALGQGPLILGHSPPPVIEAVQLKMGREQLYAGQHEMEITLSEKLQQTIPCAELVRYSNSGSEIVQAAIRVARAYTGREKIVKFEGHYHGWFDNVLISVHPPLEAAGQRDAPHAVPGTLGQAQSVLGDIIVLPWNDLHLFAEAVRKHRDEIACVIMEPIMCNTSCILPAKGYLEGVREICTEQGIMLIFDEIITGFRLGLQGAQGYLGVIPHLATFGKAMAAGFPISCLAGKRELMDLIANQKVNHSGTFNSNTLAMTAALATIAELEKDNGQIHEHLHRLGQQLMEGIKGQAEEHGVKVLVQGPGPMFHLSFTEREAITDYRTSLQCDREAFRRFAVLLLDEGVRLTGRGLWYLSAAHTEADIDFTLQAVSAAFKKGF